MKSHVDLPIHDSKSPLMKKDGCIQRDGHVLFVGAGPGQPDLLTIRAIRALEQADIVVHDQLVSPAILNLIPPHTKRILLSEILEQSTGSDTGLILGTYLADCAVNGYNVVRLKGGDPTIFARLREEIEPLVEHSVSFEIIPGITSATAAAAAAVTPLTSRSISSSLTIVTGHEAKDKKEALDYENLSIREGTIVIYMGVEQAQHWSDALLKAGRPSDTPVTLVSRCSWPDQRIIQTTLGSCALDIDMAKIPSPAVAMIGETPMRNPKPNTRVPPLQGCRLLVTRPAGQAGPVIADIARRGGEAMHLPLIDIVPASDPKELQSAVNEAWAFDWIVFTSVNGVNYFCKQMRLQELDPRALGSAQIAAIGPATKQALEEQGVICDLVPESFHSEGFVQALHQRGKKQRFLLIQAERGRDVLRTELEAAGHEVKQVAAYASQPISSNQETAHRMIKQFPVNWILLTSSFIAEAAVNIFGEYLRSWKIASISPITSSKVCELGYSVTVEANEATMKSLLDSIESWQKNHITDSRCKGIPTGKTVPAE
ncbi:MAG: uroporphyrinogen-III C-methyltransferase [Planctomycetota bacterium]|nr:uroporphyrinogen-III C-methyltransferase [Planctomycetota bacterium]